MVVHIKYRPTNFLEEAKFRCIRKNFGLSNLLARFRLELGSFVMSREINKLLDLILLWMNFGVAERYRSAIMTDKELKALVASLALSQKETDRQMKKTSREIKKISKELGSQIGGLGRKFGGFTEGMAFPSMKKILRERFHMETITPRVETSRNGHDMELDVLGYSNGEENRLVIVEVKSRLTQESIEQMERTITRFDDFFPEHADKQRFGIIAAVDISPEMEKQTLQRGFYLARIQDELFTLNSPKSFRPRYFGVTQQRHDSQ
uniref:DUF8196 domain-containing protein n=1 Tax=Candidatus Kentrum sp. UNK TaxID=2126344 RepID=A0A451B1C4_9GAMM|nr:MAG: hypothetical protein BECKUNK1418G_GA0071005_10121 [Candidatus Kentron sp. UNK]VFK72067.1 MAG: hypothetical protein BECKUNK1418H_GA0071006_109411 [Candidatus Kentron sp. UNK]